MRKSTIKFEDKEFRLWVSRKKTKLYNGNEPKLLESCNEKVCGIGPTNFRFLEYVSTRCAHACPLVLSTPRIYNQKGESLMHYESSYTT